MRKISKATIAAINRITPTELENHGMIQKAHSGYICPECGNGSGSDGTGFNLREFDSHVGGKCHKCGESFNVIKILAKHYHLDAKDDFFKLVKQACADFNIPVSFDDFDEPTGKVKRGKTRWAKDDKEISDSELKFIREDLNTSTKPLEKLLEAVQTWRGLPLDTLLKFNCRLIWEWTPPSSRTKPYTQTARVIIPCSEEAYLARMFQPVEATLPRDKQEFFRGKEKLHAGHKKLFNPDALTVKSPVFVVEGYIDAMSIDYAGYPCVALGAATRGDLLIDAVSKMVNKPQIILSLDSDSAGRDNTPKILEELISLQCPAVARFLSNDDSKIDCNDILVNEGVDTLRGRLADIVDGAISELAALQGNFYLKNKTRQSDETLHELFKIKGVSDLSFEKRLEIFCGTDVRWLTDSEQWLLWQKKGVWQRGSENNICAAHYGRRLAETLSAYAQNQTERDIADAFQSAKKISSAFTLLKTADSIRITDTDLDKHSNLLNCLNGVVDLQDGKLYPHDDSIRRKLITQQCRADYVDVAKSELVTKFFEDIQPDAETRGGLLRWLGYNLTGSVREEKFLVWLGESGANGKGVLSRTLAALLRDYAAALPRTALVLRKFDDGNAHTAALNSLINARFAISEELPQNVTLDSALLKTLTGGDMQKFRRLREEFKDFEPTAKINMSSNFIPKFENVDDGGIKRRLLVMPFNVTFTGDRADPHLKEKMMQPENLCALLRILVDEAKAWYRDGLIISPQMLETTRENLEANNFISDFLEEFCDVGEGKGEVPRRVLLDKLFEKYYQARRFTDRDLCKMIERRGIKYVRGKHGFIFKGIRLLTDDDIVHETIEDDDLPAGGQMTKENLPFDPDDMPFDFD